MLINYDQQWAYYSPLCGAQINISLIWDFVEYCLGPSAGGRLSIQNIIPPWKRTKTVKHVLFRLDNHTMKMVHVIVWRWWHHLHTMEMVSPSSWCEDGATIFTPWRRCHHLHGVKMVSPTSWCEDGVTIFMVWSKMVSPLFSFTRIDSLEKIHHACHVWMLILVLCLNSGLFVFLILIFFEGHI